MHSAHENQHEMQNITHTYYVMHTTGKSTAPRVLILNLALVPFDFYTPSYTHYNGLSSLIIHSLGIVTNIHTQVK